MSRHILPPPVTYGEHRQTWKGCENCELCQTRTKTVFFRYHVCKELGITTRKPDKTKRPCCDILGIGEAPGESEDVRGFPFVGPAGKQLSRSFNRAYDLLRDTYNVDVLPRIGLTNIIACLPLGDAGRSREPNKLEVLHCQERLDEIIASTTPRWIILLGKVAKKHFPGGMKDAVKNFKFLAGISEVYHPSHFLRMENPTQRATHLALYETELARIFKQWADSRSVK